MPHVANDLINLDRYPIHEDGPARDALLERVRYDLAKDGCAVIKGFLRPEAIGPLVREADSVAHRGTPQFQPDQSVFHRR